MYNKNARDGAAERNIQIYKIPKWCLDLCLIDDFDWKRNFRFFVRFTEIVRCVCC